MSSDLEISGLRVDVIEGTDIYATGIVISGSGLAEPVPLLPFHDAHVVEAVFLSATRLVAGSSKGEIALISVPTGVILARQLIDGRSELRWEKIFATCDRRHLVLAADDRLTILDSETLEVVRDWRHLEQTRDGWQAMLGPVENLRQQDTTRMEQVQIAFRRFDHGIPTELHDGRLMAALGGGFRPCQYGIYRFDISTGAVERQVVYRGKAEPDGNFFAFSPTGRYALRHHFDAVPFGVKPSDKQADIREEGTHAHHPDVKADGLYRFGAVIELWNLADTPRLMEKIVTRMIETGHIAFESDYYTASEIDLLAAASKVDLATSDPFGHVFTSPRLRALSGTVRQVFWDEDETGFWVRFEPHVLRRVGIDGSLSPLVAFERLAKRGQTLAPANHHSAKVVDCVRDASGRFKLTVTDAWVNNRWIHATLQWDPALLQGEAGEVVVIARSEDKYVSEKDRLKLCQAIFDEFISLTLPDGVDEGFND